MHQKIRRLTASLVAVAALGAGAAALTVDSASACEKKPWRPGHFQPGGCFNKVDAGRALVVTVDGRTAQGRL